MTALTEAPTTIEDLTTEPVVMTLGDLIRLGSMTTEQGQGWGQGEYACALSAAGIAAHQMGLVD